MQSVVGDAGKENDENGDEMSDIVQNESEQILPGNVKSHSNQTQVEETHSQQLQPILGETDNENNSVEEEIVQKNVFETVQVEREESLAIGGLFNGASAIEAIRANLCPHEKAVINENGQVLITTFYKCDDEEVECTYVYGEKTIPLNPEYTVKLNDPLSGNIPFRENVSLI